MSRRGPVLLQPLLVVLVPLEGPPSEHRGAADLDQSTCSKRLHTPGIVAIPIEYVDVKKANGRKVGENWPAA